MTEFKGVVYMTEKTTLSTKEAAAYCGVSAETIRRWIKFKDLKAFNTGSRLVIKIRKEDLDEFVQKNNILVDERALRGNGHGV